MKQILAFCLALCALYSCSKKSESPEEVLKVTLTSPKNGVTVNPATVQFSWSVSPAQSAGSAGSPGSGTMYKIKIVEIKGDQSPDNAIHTNKPIFEKDSTLELTISYPLTAMSPELKPATKYAWAVTATKQSKMVESAVGSFTTEDVLKVTLVSPENGATIAAGGDVQFSWSVSPSPSAGGAGSPGNGAAIKIKIAEIIGDQSPENALKGNKPIFEKDSCCLLTSIPFTPTAGKPGLKPGSKYSWSITATKQTAGAKSYESAVAWFNVSN